MQPTRALRNLAFELLAADTGSLAAALAMKVHLYNNDATPSEGSVLTDFTAATFTGSTPLAATAGAQQEAYNPATDASEIHILPPAGGFKWVCGATPATAESIYGFFLTDNAGTTLWGAQRFDDPIIITLINQIIDLGDVKMSLPANSVS